MREVFITTVRAGDEMAGLQRIMRSPSIAPPFRDLPLRKGWHLVSSFVILTIRPALRAGANHYSKCFEPVKILCSVAKQIEKYNNNMKSPELSHLDEGGKPRMVDVGSKAETDRTAIARARVFMSPQALERVLAGTIEKGSVASVAELAGVMAAKRTHELIPLCHPLSLTHVDVHVEWDEKLPGAEIQATCRTRGRTGVEMEALTAVTVAALTVYDMIKSVDKAARISDIRLVEKRGGKSGDLVLEAGTE